MKKQGIIWVLMMLWVSACTSEEADSSAVLKQFKLGQNEYLQFTNQEAIVVTQGDYVKIPIRIPEGVQYDVEDISFTILDHDYTIATVSKSKNDETSSMITLLAGPRAGSYALQAQYNNLVMDTVEFEVIAGHQKPGSNEGSGSWIGGDNRNNFHILSGDAPFEGDITDKPYDLTPGEARGTYNIAVFYVDFIDAKLGRRLPNPRTDLGPERSLEEKQQVFESLEQTGYPQPWPHYNSDNAYTIDYAIDQFWAEVSAENININYQFYPHIIHIDDIV